MAASQAYLDEARASRVAFVPLVQITLPGAPNRVLRLSTAQVFTPNVNGVTTDPETIWEPAIADMGTIRAPGAFLSPGPDLCSCSFKLVAFAKLSKDVGQR